MISIRLFIVRTGIKIFKLLLTYMEELIGNNLLSEKAINAKKNLLDLINRGQSKEYLGKVYTDLNNLNEEDILILNEKYESKLSSQMSKALGKSIIRAYSNVACIIIKIAGSEDNLTKDLDEDPFLNRALQRITCNLYHSFGEYLAPISVALITGKQYSSFTPESAEIVIETELIDKIS